MSVLCERVIYLSMIGILTQNGNADISLLFYISQFSLTFGRTYASITEIRGYNFQYVRMNQNTGFIKSKVITHREQLEIAWICVKKRRNDDLWDSLSCAQLIFLRIPMVHGIPRLLFV